MQMRLEAIMEEVDSVGLHHFLDQPWDVLVQEHMNKVQLSGLSQKGDAFIRCFATLHQQTLGTLGCYAILLTEELAELAFERIDALGLISLTP